MSKLEKFSLITGIIGLVADVLALFVFFDSYISGNSPSKPSSSLLHFIILFLYIYGWFITSWVITKNRQRKLYSSGSENTLLPFLLGSGIFLIPIVGAWLYLIIKGTINNTFIAEFLVAILGAVFLNLIVGAGIMFSVYFLIVVIGDE